MAAPVAAPLAERQGANAPMPCDVAHAWVRPRCSASYVKLSKRDIAVLVENLRDHTSLEDLEYVAAGVPAPRRVAVADIPWGGVSWPWPCSLSNTGLGVEEARLLASALAANKNLVTLKYVRVCRRRDRCAAVGRLIDRCTVTQVLRPAGARSLQSNEIGDEGAQAILEALASNRSSALTTLAYAWPRERTLGPAWRRPPLHSQLRSPAL